MKKLYTLLMAAVAAVSMNAEPITGAELYLRGGFNSWSTSDKFTETSAGVYKIDVATIQGEFKIADATWGTYDFGGNGAKIEFDTPYKVVAKGGNMTLAAGKADNVTFTFDTNGENPVLTVTGKKGEITEYTVAIAGAFNNWSADANCATVPAANPVAQIVVPNYCNTVEGVDGDGFKIVVNGTWYSTGMELGAGVPEVIEGNDEANMLVDFSLEGSAVLFTFDCSTFTLTVSADAGVEGVVADASQAAPVYFNLQGVRVANPQNGLFIVVRGSNVAKVIL